MCFLIITVSLFLVATSSSPARADVRAQVQALFEQDLSTVDFAKIMVDVELIINPRIDGAAMLAEIDRMTAHIQTAISPSAPEWDKVDAIRQYIYEPGYWNDNRAFAYDLDDPYGLVFETRLLSDYLSDRRGNCVTMPFLFIAIGQRLGLDMRPSLAPQHVLVRFTTADGKDHNIEATNGGLRGDNAPYVVGTGLATPAVAQSLDPTPTMRGGANNYRPGAPIVDRIGGGGFWMTGTVRRAGDGVPLMGRRIQIWAHTTEGHERDARSHGATLTDAEGKFRLEMPQIVPAFGQAHGHLVYDADFDDGGYETVFLRPVMTRASDKELHAEFVLRPV